MSGSCRVTPGATVGIGDLVDATIWNLIATPQVDLEAQSVGKTELIKGEVIELLGTGLSNYNYLDNGNFAENRWSRGATPTSCPAGARTFRADQWWTTPSGAAVTYERVVNGPNAVSLHAAKLTGATSVTTVDFGQDIPRRIGSALGRKLVLSFWLRNDTGANLTPTVLLNTATSPDNFSAVTTQLLQTPSTPTTTAQWHFYEIPLDATTTSDLNLGLQIVFRLPAGALNNASKSVQFAQLKLETSDEPESTPFVPQREPDEVSAAAAGAGNLLRNGQFDRFTAPGAAVSCSAAADTANAEAWFVNPVGGAVTASRQTAGPPNNLTGFCQRVTGAGSVNAVDIGQNIATATAYKLRRNVTFAVWVRYHDGSTSATITPALKLATPATGGDFLGATVQATVTLDPCINDTWTQLNYTFDGSLISNIANGLRLYLEFPSGSLDSAAKYVDLAQAQLREGVTLPTLSPYVEPSEPAVTGQQAGLLIVNASTTTFTITADEIALRNVEGRAMIANSVSCTVNKATTGVNGIDTGSPSGVWGYVWIISNGSSHAGLVSISATTPTLPAGYTFKALVGTVWIAASTFIAFHQVGRRVWIDPVKIFENTSTVTTSLAALSLAAGVPPNARAVYGILGVTTTSPAIAVALASTASGTTARGAWIFNTAAATLAAIDTWFASRDFELPLITAQTIYVKALSGSPTYRLDVTGYTL